MRLSALFEEFRHYLRVEKEAAPRSLETYRWCFGDFLAFARTTVGGTVLVGHFTPDLCRAYQYDLAARQLRTNTIRLRLATLGSFGKWAVRQEKLPQNPVERLTRPRPKARLPRVPRWETVERLLDGTQSARERALVALMAYGGLRRSEIVALDRGDFDPEFGLRRVQGKGGREAAVPLPAVARAIVSAYLGQDRQREGDAAPMFIVRYRTTGGRWEERRMGSQRLWKVIRGRGGAGRRAGASSPCPAA